MRAVIGLLRGVNVGGKHKLPMATLRLICEGLGLHHVSTYIQSGNVVFAQPGRAAALEPLATRLELAIEAECGFRPAVLLRTAEELREAVEENPFAPEAAAEPQKLVVTFLRQPPPAPYLDRLDALRAHHPERFALRGLTSYTFFPHGQGQTKLPLASLERALGAPCTARNWNTVVRLHEMAEAIAQA